MFVCNSGFKRTKAELSPVTTYGQPGSVCHMKSAPCVLPIGQRLPSTTSPAIASPAIERLLLGLLTDGHFSQRVNYSLPCPTFNLLATRGGIWATSHDSMQRLRVLATFSSSLHSYDDISSGNPCPLIQFLSISVWVNIVLHSYLLLIYIVYIYNICRNSRNIYSILLLCI